jgi:hypothetical protein
MVISANPAGADVTAVRGDAFGFMTHVGLFGGPQSTHGPRPRATLPAGGSANPIVATAPDGEKGQYGPAVVFGGIWPDEAPTGGPSGPITSRTEGTLGPNGSVTSSVDIVMHNPGRPLAPGGIGPGPLISQEVHSTCTANESGISGSVTFHGGIIETKYSPETQLPVASEPIPTNPPAFHTREGTLDHVGDHYRIVLNEQFRNDDGSVTINAAHMYLLGPIAVGEMIVGQVTCGVTGGPSAAAPAPSPGAPAAPTPGAPAAATPSGQSPAPGAAPVAGDTAPTSTVPGTPGIDPSASSTVPSGGPGTTTRAGGDGSSNLAARPLADSDDGGSPLIIPALVLVVGGVGGVIWARRRRLSRAGPASDGPA